MSLEGSPLKKNTPPTPEEQEAALARLEANNAKYTEYVDAVASEVQKRAEAQGLHPADTGWVIEILRKDVPDVKDITPDLIDSAIEQVKDERKRRGL